MTIILTGKEVSPSMKFSDLIQSGGSGYHGPFTWKTRQGRVLTDAEIASLIGRKEQWSVRMDAGWVSHVEVEFTSCGFASYANETKGTFRSAVEAAMCRWKSTINGIPVRLTDPDGVDHDLVSIRFVGENVTHRVPYVYSYDSVATEKRALGSKVDGCRLFSGWVYGSGTLRHLEATRHQKGLPSYAYSELERREAESASWRATLAVLRYFRMYPIRRHVWVEAAVETPYIVEMRVNDGPWVVVGPKGIPVEANHP